jgi:hypothetical protein
MEGNPATVGVLNLLFFCVVFKDMMITIYRTIHVTVTVVLYGCETWSSVFREAHKLRMFENSVPRKLFGTRSEEVTGENCIMRNLMPCWY